VRALLDTHTFLWAALDDRRLSSRAADLVADIGNEIYLSAVSVWEVAIKHSRGRLSLPEPPDSYIPSRIAVFGYRPLPVEVAHALRAGRLPPHHRDPFDRMLVAQAQVEGLPILTSDANIGRYEVEVIW